MNLQNDSEQLKKLLEEPKEEETRNRERLRALYAISIGHSIPEVAKIFCVDEQTIYNWIEKWREDRDVSDKPKSGRPPAFTEEEKKELKKLIDENEPKEHGINASFWDCAELRRYYLKSGKDISEDAIERTLLSMGAHYVKAQIEYKEADFRKQRKFALQFLRDLKKKTEATILLFEDEMSANTAPHKGYGWTFNENLIVKVAQSKKKRTNCFGAVNPVDGKEILMTSKVAKASAFVKFLDKINEIYKDAEEIWLYLDNSQVHKAEVVKNFLKENRRIKLKPLPPYSPDINPQENMWRYSRYKVLNNRSFNGLHQLSMTLNWFVKRLEPKVVRSVCSMVPIETLLSFQA